MRWLRFKMGVRKAVNVVRHPKHIMDRHGNPVLGSDKADGWQTLTLLREINFGEDVEIDPSCGLCIGVWNMGGESRRRRHPDCERHRL